MVIGGTSNSLGKKIVGKKQKKTDTNTALHGDRRHLKLFEKKIVGKKKDTNTALHGNRRHLKLAPNHHRHVAAVLDQYSCVFHPSFFLFYF
jgi:hypothetical protein